MAGTACVVALGGGVVGDIAGFAAAIYQRGVDFVQVPTTLLAQVDSAVGGKTGVNHPGGKNLIGAFHQPRCVLSDTDTLAHAAGARARAGLAEVVKYGLIADAGFFDWLEEHPTALLAPGPGGARPRHPPLLRDQGRDRRPGRARARAPRPAEPRPHLRPCDRDCRRLRRVAARRGGRRRQLHGGRILARGSAGWAAADVERMRPLLQRRGPAESPPADRGIARLGRWAWTRRWWRAASGSCCSSGIGDGVHHRRLPAAARCSATSARSSAVPRERAARRHGWRPYAQREAGVARPAASGACRRDRGPSTSATATASCTRRRSAAWSTRPRSSSITRATSTAPG